MLKAAPQKENYRAEISAPVSPDTARTAIFDQMHLWWTDRTERTPTGVTVRFNRSHASFVFDAQNLLIWRCTDANMIIEGVHDSTEWTGTRLIWEITPSDAGCTVTLEHDGLNEALECLDVCSRGWQHFFEASLLAHLTGATPSPQTH